GIAHRPFLYGISRGKATSRVLRLQGGQSFYDSFASSSLLSATSFSMGGLVSKLPSASVKSLSIIGRNVGEGGPPYFNGKGGIAVSQPLNYLSPTMITKKTENCVDRRTNRAS
ncbi:hypothetical protein CCACVL1_04230, partial [Corchorus capsularis]